MPDLVTHAVIPYLVVKFWKRLNKINLAIFLLGAILPDLLSRSFNVFLMRWVLLISDYTDPIHTPCMIVLYCGVISFFFADKIRKEVFWFLLLGSFLHLAFDLFQTNFGYGYDLLFPFSYWRKERGLIWPEDTLWLVPFLAAVWLAVVIRDKIKNQKTNHEPH